MESLSPIAHPSSKHGLTSIEVMGILVVAVIAVLLFGLQTNHWEPPSSKTRSNFTRLFVGQTSAHSLNAYQADMGNFPSSGEGLAALFEAPAGKEARWHGPYLKDINGEFPLDPWKEPYIYRQPGTHNPAGYDLFSKGPDRIEGTADDIGNR